MGIDDFYPDEYERAFLRDAANIVYDWLPPDKRTKLNLELSGEGLSSIEELRERERFFRLLHFLEVNYVKPVDWAEQTIERLRKIARTQRTEAVPRDIEIDLLEKEAGSFYRVSKELSESGIKNLFYTTLEKLELDGEYKRYLLGKGETGKLE